MEVEMWEKRHIEERVAGKQVRGKARIPIRRHG
jgi:hypothetical protein